MESNTKSEPSQFNDYYLYITGILFLIAFILSSDMNSSYDDTSSTISKATFIVVLCFIALGILIIDSRIRIVQSLNSSTTNKRSES
ncbi:MAG: hypothetical protein GPJ54_05735 [Candidatus Heimdallarchaeota archaeon]|nr:hypothetical protein [Candidatus Heimdallarchaeota archaeon]